MNVGDIFEVKIIDDNYLGNGIAKIDNFPIFVSRGVTGDVLKIKITKVLKKYAYASIISFVSKDSREKDLCPYFDKCGGCDLLHISYDKEIALKKEYIQRLFKDEPVAISFFDRFDYRNKITLHVKNKKIGLYKKDSNEIVEIDKCFLVSDNINKLMMFLKNMDLSKITEITIREGLGLLLSVTGSISNKNIKSLINYPNLKSIYENDKLIYGDEYLKVNFNNLNFFINNNSFLQVNTNCAISLYEKIKEYIGKSDRLLDLYCGSATIGIYISDICKNITGVEINKDSVLCGKKNIKENNISNYEIIRGDAKDIEGCFDTIVVDPPRTGLSKTVIDFINNSNCEKVVYVSCNPTTLKRDIDMLYNYNIKKMDIFNMFPATKHIEVICVLERNSMN